MICASDDLGVKCQHCVCDKVTVAVIPVHDRLPLLPHTIKRLLRKNNVSKVICVGDGHQERKVCESAGAQWVQYRNRPLGAKWNAGMMEAKQFNPDLILFSGSSDWLSNNWLDKIIPLMNTHSMAGKPDMNLLDITTKKGLFRAMHWPGYVNNRRDESIGIGRVLSRETMDLIGWKPFDDQIERGLDYSMQKKVQRLCNKPIALVKDIEIQSLSISTDKWSNRHVFEQHWQGILPSQKIDAREIVSSFPEALEIFNIQNPHFNEIPWPTESLQ